MSVVIPMSVLVVIVTITVAAMVVAPGCDAGVLGYPFHFATVQPNSPTLRTVVDLYPERSANAKVVPSIGHVMTVSFDTADIPTFPIDDGARRTLEPTGPKGTQAQACRPAGFPFRNDLIMFDTIFGVPVHPLAVHATVVLVPTAAIEVAIAALWPAARARLGWITPVVVLADGTSYLPPGLPTIDRAAPISCDHRSMSD